MRVNDAANTTETIDFTLPEPGQLVEVRRRRWVVADVSGSNMSMDRDPQHLVNLSSLDEDSLGEELQVVWQIEPGARVLEKTSLPSITGWDSSETQEAFLDAVRWGAVTNADKSFLQAPFRSGITIEDYQLDPLVRALDMARVNLLIADDVGLGKTIEAGLVVQELLVRHRARSVFVVCPASLQIKWQTEMQEKFGLEFRIVDTAYIKKLRRERGISTNPWTSFPRLITSMDWLKSGEGLRLLKEALPPHITYPRMFDILIVDEAHNVAPSSSSLYAIESQRTRAIRTLAPHFEHRLFLSATPHNGYQESFTSLLELLDDQRFARTVMPDQKQLDRIMVRRLKSDLVDADGKPLYPKRVLKTLDVEYTQEELEMHDLLRTFTESREKSVKGTKFSFGTDFLHKLLKKRLFSSPRAFALTLEKYDDSLRNGRRKKVESSFDDKILRKAIMEAQDDYADDDEYEWAQEEAVETTANLTVPLDDDQRRTLDRLLDWSRDAQHKADSKAKALVEWLEGHLKTDGKWNDKRVILFTEYRATHTWLQEILVAHGFGGQRLEFLHGGVQGDDREKVKAAFQTDPSISPVRILLATDAASEGIDLQNFCNYLIHIEIPWNPNVMEQRNGRIDRHGQKSDEVYIWHPVTKGFQQLDSSDRANVGKLQGDLEFLVRAAMKVDNIREDLGSVGPVIAKQIEDAMLGRRDGLDTREAESKASNAKKFVAAERKLKEKIASLHGKLEEARTDFHLSAEHIQRAVFLALELAEKPSLQLVELNGAPSGTVFEVPMLPGSWGKATQGLEHPYTGKRRPITFDFDVSKGRDDVVLAHLNHKLVQMSLRLLREELWSLDDVKKLHRVGVKTIDDKTLDHPIVFVWSRLVVTGSAYNTLHEEITLSGGELKGSGYARIREIGRLESLMSDSVSFVPDVATFDVLKRRFKNEDSSVMDTIDARSKDRLKFLENTLNRRKEEEKKNIVEVLDELARNIESELSEMVKPKQQVFDLFKEDELEQIRKDANALRRRLERIPSEKAKEIEAIECRYDGIESRTFPVAVTFLVPRHLAEGGLK